MGRIATVLLAVVVQAGLFFLAAGTFDVPRAWIYAVTVLVYLAIAMPVLFIRFPQVIAVINERGRYKPDTKIWDKVWGIVDAALLLAIPLIAGMDVGHGGASVSLAFLVPALVATIVAYIVAHWTMVVNPYAETGVRVQADRGHEVVTRGPYRYVRHPFYVSMIVQQVAYPAAVGSTLAYVPVLAFVGALVWRTGMEDRTLRAELPGYAAYAEGTRWRLLPGVW